MARWTNYPNGITSLGIPTFGTGIIPPFPSNYFFVQETTTAGVAAGAGTAQSPFNTLDQALAECTSGDNDVIFFTGTMHLTSALTWNKNNTHLVGLCAPLKRGKRARISSSGTTPFSYLVNVSANGCIFQNFGTFYGFPTTGATTPICWNDTGGRNAYNNVEFLGFGDATPATGTANQTAARAFVLNTSVGETTLRNCVFGPDTVVRNAANSTIEIAGHAPRVTFDNCVFEADLGSSGGGAVHVTVGSGGIDRYVDMADNLFLNAMNSGATAMTQCMSLDAAAGGLIYSRSGNTGYGFTNWETTASGILFGFAPTIVASGKDAGIGLEITP